MKKNKPDLQQNVFVFYKNEIYNGTVHEIHETPNAFFKDEISYCFTVIIKNQIYTSPSFLNSSIIIPVFNIYSSSFHFEPLYDANIRYNPTGNLTNAFVFKSMKSFKKWETDLKMNKRNYHLKKAEEYA